MPLIYLPLIMYAGWMELLLQPLRQSVDRAATAADAHAYTESLLWSSAAGRRLTPA